MKSVLPVKMLAALALVLLVSSATEGRILRKCELKAQLEAARIQVTEAMGDKMTVDDLIARLVCKANASGFNTSFVKAIGPKPKENKPLINIHSLQLYGVFQLSDQLACDSGMMPSLNVCEMSCSALIDDDVTDDIACLKTMIDSKLNTILVKECDSVDPTRYFAECLNEEASLRALRRVCIGISW
ncbi:lysozyme C, milk isozyme-like [Rhinichthys klamathensis goyatoka]|uniref:lysozyme C, milk isozyme-like n=1 Tax=Rhinichthys klamathensis goyatoka TaxID=3034132 RepID=UPI0024B57A8C|nr:lysozyme C, milk isozyme-like [Rhinichthys klamathensis goyatoka]